MNDTRARFEEIWPVPEGVSWYEEAGEYVPDVYNGDDDFFYLSCEWDARLDTFTRCQETTDVYVSLVEELVRELENAAPWIHDSNQYCFAADVVNRAKQIIGDR